MSIVAPVKHGNIEWEYKRMGELILCRRQAADVPYYIEQHSVNIYSVEELCFFFLSHMDSLDEGLLTEELFLWLEQELSMTELVQSLREDRQNHMPLTKSVRTILDSNGFCSVEEKKQIEESLREVENKSEAECYKIRADRNLKNHRYAAAIREYNRLLARDDMQRADAEVLGNIWNNIAIAHAGMFLYQDAIRCFEKAYEYNNDPVCMEEIEEAKHLAQIAADVNDKFGITEAADISEELSETLEEIHKYEAMGDIEAAERKWRELLNKQEMIYENSSRLS